ncbi:MAG: efflux RND transporter periplasmic adaptor subunit [Planctomycetaceae bacterium]
MSAHQNSTASVASAPRGRSFRARIPGAVFIVACVLVGWLVIENLVRPPAEAEPVAEESEAAESSLVVLPEAKLQQAKFVVEPVQLNDVVHVHTVPGRLGYDEARHIEIKAPVGGILTDVLVTPGDQVVDGQVLAVVNSSEVGQARAAVLNEEAALKRVQLQHDRLKEITDNLRSLFVLLDRNEALDEIERQFRDRMLGRYREEIMSAYSEQQLAAQLASASRPLVDSGSLPLKTVRERESARHVSDARFRSVRETTASSILVESQTLEAQLADARRQLMIARNHLQTLLGVSENSADYTAEALSRMEVRAPFSGTIESRFLAKSERVAQSDALFILANTETLYVTADIRENDFNAMSVTTGQELVVTAPALPDIHFTAKVHYVGREVQRNSNSLPLVAIIANPDGHLRPGMFVRVDIPMAEAQGVTSVKAESVLQHENERFVFVQTAENSFRKVTVQTGLGNEQWTQITRGLEVGQPVVSTGAFLLKSELLLASEE